MSDSDSVSSSAAPLHRSISSSPSSGRKKWLACASQSKLVRWVNGQTASFCEDHERPKDIHQPNVRVLTRFIFTLLLCLLGVLLVFLVLFRQESTFHTERYWGQGYALHRFSHFLSLTNATEDPNYNTQAASTLCPCANTAFSWAHFAQLFTISMEPGHQTPVQTSLITNGSEFCMHQISKLSFSSLITTLGCPNLLNSVTSKSDERTILSSVSLMDPVLLRSTVRRYMQSNLDKALNDCVYLMANETNWHVSQPFSWLRNLYELLTAALQQYESNSSSSEMDFWSSANRTSIAPGMPLVQLLGNKTAVGIQINWINYLARCSPIYCDVVKETSMGAKFFSVLAQIGGFGALMLLIVRKVLWPMVCIVCSWSL